MTSDQVVVIAALVGAVVGSLVSFVGQALLDHARERARAREAAAMLRAELVRGQTAVVFILKASTEKSGHEGTRGLHLLAPRGSYFDALGLGLSSKMPLSWFTSVMAVYARWDAAMTVARALEETKKEIAATERDFLEKWVTDADLAQELLWLVSVRWWKRLRSRDRLRRVTELLDADARESADAFQKLGVESYFAFRGKRSRP